MNVSVCCNKAVRGCKESAIPALVRVIKLLKLDNDHDFLQLGNLSESIFEEWLIIKNRFRKKIKNKKINEIYAVYEAEEEIVVGLIGLLNQKIINYVMQACNDVPNNNSD